MFLSFFSLLYSPYTKDDMISVQIMEDVYLTGLEECKNHLHERITLSMRDTLFHTHGCLQEARSCLETF